MRNRVAKRKVYSRQKKDDESGPNKQIYKRGHGTCRHETYIHEILIERKIEWIFITMEKYTRARTRIVAKDWC